MFCKGSSALFFSIYFLNYFQCFAAINERCGINGAGICKPICTCQLAIDIINKGQRPKLPVCGFDQGNDPLVCCYPNHDFLRTDLPSHRLSASFSQTMCSEHYYSICESNRITVQNCKNKLHNTDYTALYPAAVGGELAYPKELPFMGLVGYQVNDEIDWSCGCSLISDRFVLSAGHCTKHPTYGFARVVRLGELDYSTKNEHSAPLDYKIIKYINHPDYKYPFVYNDIALYKLDRTVMFDDFIRPICLPSFKSFNNIQTVFGAGWGRTDFVGPKSSALIKVNLDYLRIDQCSNTVDKNVMPRGLDNNTMLCSGVLAGGRDTCLGDSGGPLFLPPPEDSTGCHLYTQLGVTSFGKNCAVAGYPGVYTNVLHFVPWIESIVWPYERSEPKPIWTN